MNQKLINLKPNNLTDVDLDLAAEYFERFMMCLGLDPYEGHLQGTAQRVARFYRDMFTIPEWNLTTFDIEEHGPGQVGDSGMVIVRDIPFVSTCAHHFAPFAGSGTIAYIPQKQLVGLSKFARALATIAAGPQVQERIGQQLADFIVEEIDPIGCAVILRAEHSCMTARGARAHSSETITSTLRGVFYTDNRTRSEFLQLMTWAKG